MFFFKLSGESSATAVPRRVVFDRDTAFFKSDEQHVDRWIRSIDEWIASTNVRHAMRLEQARRERAWRDDAKTMERERIGQINERFKHLESSNGSRSSQEGRWPFGVADEDRLSS